MDPRTADNRAGMLARFFFSRRDVVAVSAPWGKGAPCPAAAGDLLEALLAGHVSGCGAPIQTVCHTSKGDRAVEGLFRVGSYVPAPDMTTPWLCLDFDGAGHAGALADPLATAVRALDAARDMDLPAYLERSGGGHGWHVWIFFEAGVLASAARKLGYMLAPKDAPLAEGGTANPESAIGIEVFPKQDKLTGKNGKGNLVWLPWWSGAKDGANEFCDDGGVPLNVDSFERVSASELSAVLTADAGRAAPGESGVGGEPRAPASAEIAEWKREALRSLPLEAIYGQWLTGRSSGPGWLECRDPWSPSGDKNPSAGVATGEGEAVRGVFKSFVSAKRMSVFDFLMERGEAKNYSAAADIVARLSGVARTRPKATEKKTPEKKPTSPALVVTGGRDLTDLGNAERMMDKFGDRIRYADGRGWLTWAGAVWVRDPKGVRVRGMASEVARGIREEAGRCKGGKDEYAALSKHAYKSESNARVAAMVSLVAPMVLVHAEDFDANPWEINTPGGIVDLETGTVRPHEPSALCTMITRAGLEREPRGERWDRFLEEVQPDPEVRGLIQRWAGSCLTGIARDRIIMFWTGNGANGKGRLAEALAWVLGDYAAAVPQKFFQGRDTGALTTLARLPGKRMIYGSELNEKQAFDVELLKRLSGGDTTTACQKYEVEFDFRPTLKAVVYANGRPPINDQTSSIWDRLRIVDFPTKFVTGENRDEALEDKLRADAARIFAWMLEGCAEWRQIGIGSAASVDEETREERRSQDPFAEFWERFVFAPDTKMSTADIYAEFRSWAQAQNWKKIPGINKISGACKAKDLKPWRTGSARGYYGIAMRDSNGDPRMQDRINQPEIDFNEAREKQMEVSYDY